MNGKKLYRDMKNKAISGVCAGLAKYLDMDLTLVRLLAVLIGLFVGGVPVLIAYIVCVAVVPEEPNDNNVVDGTSQNNNM